MSRLIESILKGNMVEVVESTSSQLFQASGTWRELALEYPHEAMLFFVTVIVMGYLGCVIVYGYLRAFTDIFGKRR